MQLYIDFFKNIVNTNVAAFITALVSIAVIYAVQRWISPRFKRKLKMPLPIELIMVCIQKCLSYIVYERNILHLIVKLSRKY